MITYKFSVFTSWNQYRAFGWRTLAARGSSLDSTFISLQGYRNTNTIERVSQSSIASRYSTIKRTFTRKQISAQLRLAHRFSIVQLTMHLATLIKCSLAKFWALKPSLPSSKKFFHTFFSRSRSNFTRFVRKKKMIPRYDVDSAVSLQR